MLKVMMDAKRDENMTYHFISILHEALLSKIEERVRIRCFLAIRKHSRFDESIFYTYNDHGVLGFWGFGVLGFRDFGFWVFEFNGFFHR